MTWNLYNVLAVCLCAAGIYCFLISFSKSIRALLRFTLRAGVGIGSIALFNSIASAYSIGVGINLYTCIICGLFGFPGYILLVGTRLLF